MIQRALLLAVCALASASVSSADILLFKDGRFIDGRKMKRVEGYVEVQYDNGVIRVRDDLIEAFATDDLSYTPTTDEEKAKYAEGMRPFEGKWLKESAWKRKVSRAIDEKRAEVEDAVAHSEWGNRYQDKSKNFQWHYTVPKKVGEYFQVRCEAYFTKIAKDWKVKRDKKKPPMAMNLFSSRKEFKRTGGAGGGALAYFMFIGNYDLCLFYDRLDADFTEMVLYHELSHYMQKLLDEDFKMPHWPGEALAEYYGAMKYDEKTRKWETGLLQDGRLAEVHNDMKKGELLSIKKMILTDAYSDYTWGWSFAHFLMSDPDHAKKFTKFFVGLAKDKKLKRTRGSFNLKFVESSEVLRYFMETFNLDDEGLTQLEREWHSFVEGLETTSTTGLDKAAAKALGDGYRIQGKRLLEEAIDAGSVNPQTYHRYARLVRSESPTDAIKNWERAIDLDPLIATYYWEMSKVVSKKDKKEGERLTELAKELDPHIEVTWISVDY